MNLARMMAAAHVNGVPPGYAWLVLAGASGCTSACTRKAPGQGAQDPIGRGMAENAGDPTTVHIGEPACSLRTCIN
jgi:hypothetical protein